MRTKREGKLSQTPQASNHRREALVEAARAYLKAHRSRPQSMASERCLLGDKLRLYLRGNDFPMYEPVMIERVLFWDDGFLYDNPHIRHAEIDDYPDLSHKE